MQLSSSILKNFKRIRSPLFFCSKTKWFEQDVFNKKQFYSDIKGLPEKLNQMTFDKYDLQEWNLFKSNLNPIKIDKSITGENVKELFKKENDSKFMAFKDYFDRKMILKQTIFDFHTKGKYVEPNENRHQLFPFVKEALKNPNKVWYNKPDKMDGKFQSRYIKFYGDIVFVVDCEMRQNGLEIQTWYESKKEDLNFRKGLLIRNKVYKTPVLLRLSRYAIPKSQ